MQVEGHHGGCLQLPMATGEWVSNRYPTFPPLLHRPAKAGLIRDGPMLLHGGVGKGLFRWRMGMHPIS